MADISLSLNLAATAGAALAGGVVARVLRQSVLLEQEQTELRTDWLHLHAVEERLRLLRENLARLSQS